MQPRSDSSTQPAERKANEPASLKQWLVTKAIQEAKFAETLKVPVDDITAFCQTKTEIEGLVATIQQQLGQLNSLAQDESLRTFYERELKASVEASAAEANKYLQEKLEAIRELEKNLIAIYEGSPNSEAISTLATYRNITAFTNTFIVNFNKCIEQTNIKIQAEKEQVALLAAGYVKTIGDKLHKEADRESLELYIVKELKMDLDLTNRFEALGIPLEYYNKLNAIKEYYLKIQCQFKDAKQMLISQGLVRFKVLGEPGEHEFDEKFEQGNPFLRNLMVRMEQMFTFIQNLGFRHLLIRLHNADKSPRSTQQIIDEITTCSVKCSSFEEVFGSYLWDVTHASAIAAREPRKSGEHAAPTIAKPPIEKSDWLVRKLPPDVETLAHIAQFIRNAALLLPELKDYFSPEMKEQEMRAKLEDLKNKLTGICNAFLQQAEIQDQKLDQLDTKKLPRKLKDKALFFHLHLIMKDKNINALQGGELVRFAEQILLLDKEILRPMKEARLLRDVSEADERFISALNLIYRVLGEQLKDIPKAGLFSKFSLQEHVKQMHSDAEVKFGVNESVYSKLTKLRQHFDNQDLQRILSKYKEKDSKPTYIIVLKAVNQFLMDKNVEALRGAVEKFLRVAPAQTLSTAKRTAGR